MEAIIEIIIKILAEILLQFLAEVPFEWLRFNAKKENPRLFAFSLSFFLGIVAGIISLVVFKDHFIPNVIYRSVNLVVTPVLVGGLFVYIHDHRNYRTDRLYLFSSFWNAYVFALCVAVIRFILAGHGNN